MHLGVVFPQIDIDADAGAIRAYAAAVEEAGYDHLLAYDHVLGADRSRHPGWSGPYDSTHTFHEPMVLFGFLAGICRLELVSGVVILPQRQAVLVAKQAAEVDVLTGGRLRLGVGLGWNRVEYEALDSDFGNRGRRMEEQIEVMRLLWTEPVVDFTGEWHRVDGASIAPLPIQRPIPIWFGVGSDRRALERAGRLADGWMPFGPPGAALQDRMAVVHESARQAGRDPASLGLQSRIDYGDGDMDRLAKQAAAWRAAGATHLSVNTMNAGLATIDDHIDALRRTAAAIR